MGALKNVISSKQQILKFISGTPKMVRDTEEIYLKVLTFYLHVIQQHLDELENWSRESGTKALEKLTIRTSPRTNKQTGEKTGGNPNPPYPLDETCPKFPSILRRAVIAKAIGMAQSWQSNYKKWCKKRDKIKSKNQDRLSKGKNPIPFHEHPPKYPTPQRVGITYYKGEYRNLHTIHHTVDLKVWTGSDWGYITIQIEPNKHTRKLHLSDEWDMTVPTLYERNGSFYLITAFEKTSHVVKFADYYQTEDPRVMGVDLNMGRRNRAVCSLMDRKGTVHRVKHIGLKACNTTDVQHTLGLMSRNISKLKLIPKGQQACKKLWRKALANLDNYAHHMSKILVELAQEWGVKVIVFENLKHFRPQKDGRSSAQMRHRQQYWAHRRIIKYTTYKAKAQGILIGLVTPAYTSQRCSLCGSINTTRKTEILTCNNCGHTHNAQINASINIGYSWFIRELQRVKKAA